MKNQPEFKGVVYGGVSNLLMNLLTNEGIRIRMIVT